MNPLHRKMFRQPGMSRQPMGILASSPQLANVVRQRMGQPVQMAHGGYHPPRSPMGRMSTSRRPAAGDVRIPLVDMLPKSGLARPALDRFMAAASDDIPSTGIGAIRGRAQQDALTDLAMRSIRQGGSPFGDDDGSRQVSDAERMAANRANLSALRSAQGLGQGAQLDTVPSDPLLKIGKVNFGNILSDATGRQPIGQSEGGRQRSAALADAPSKIASGLRSGLGNLLPQAEGYAPYRPKPPAEIKKRIGEAILGPSLLPTSQDVAASLQDDPAVFDPGSAIPDFEIGRSGLPDDDMTAAEELAANATTPPTDGKPRKVTTTDPTGDGTTDSGAKITPAGQLQSIFGRNLSPSEVTQSFEADINKFNNAYLTGITENRQAVIDSEARLKSATELFDKTLNEKRKTAKEFTLEDVKDEALKISGIDKTDYDDKRKDAFFMGLMRAGLAIAAGESPNTLTNVARGLGIGLEGYGKDISTLNAQEREDRKELRAISMDLIKTKNDREMALTAAENEHLYQRQRLAQAEKQGADSALLAAQNRENSYKLNGLQLQANLSYQLNQLKQADKKLAVDTAYKDWSAKIAMLPEEAKQTMVIDGFGGYNAETGQFELTEEGQTYYKNLVALGSKSNYKITDLDKQANALSTGGTLFGVNLSTDSATAKNQSLRWMTNFKERYDKASEDITDPLKKTEAEKQRTAILTEWQMSESPTISTREEFDALPSGSLFVQNNVLQRKP